MACQPRGAFRYKGCAGSILSLGLVLSLGIPVVQAASIVEQISYHDNEARWVLGQVATRSINGVAAEQVSFDPTVALPVQIMAFGKLTESLTYNADGTVATVRDGNGSTTVLSNWKRGIAQTVTSADGASQRAVVDGRGWIVQVTDQNGYSSQYQYDQMGRLVRVDYPAGDAVAWNATTTSFTQVFADEYGIPSGHWRRTVTTGNSNKVVYYDAMWRPVLVAAYDAADPSGTLRFTGHEYDNEGRVAFTSYASSTSNPDKGTWTRYDPLGRTVSVSQDSEQGLQTRAFSYQADGAGLYTVELNARGAETRTWYQIFDEPSFDSPVRIVQAEGAVTLINRDAFGKPTSISRGSADGTLKVTRSYEYNQFHELCRVVEPESGATLMGYDGAGNLSWSAAGLPGTSGCEAEGTSAAIAARRVDRRYDNRNQLRTLVFPDGNGNQSWSYSLDGKVSRIVTSNGGGAGEVINAYAYNKRRLLTGESIEQVGLPLMSLGYAYDANASMAGVQYPSGQYVDYAPNALGQPTRAGTYVTGVSYHPNGGMKRFTYGNGIVHTMQQNARHMPSQVLDGGVLDNTYNYDANGNVAQIVDGISAQRTRVMAYDGLDRLTRTVSTAFGGNGEMSYSYDALDNLRSARLPGVKDHTYWYDGNNRLTNVLDATGATVVGMTYDVQGNLATRNGQGLAFDFGNRLRSSTGKEAYRYDGHGRRVLQEATAGNIMSLYGEDGVLRRRDSERDARTVEYIHLNGSLVAQVETPNTPLSPTVTVPAHSSTGSFTVVWSSVASVTRYEVQERANGGAWSSIYSGPALSSTVTGKGGGTYGYRVRGCLDRPCSAWSAESSIVVQSAPSAGPVVSAPGLSIDGQYTVSWTAIASASTYRLEENANGGGWAEIQSATATFIAFNGKPDGSYAYRASACNAAGCGDVGAAATVQVLRIPAGMSTVSLPALSVNGSFTVAWTAVAGATVYRLEQSAAGGAWALQYSGLATSMAFAQLADGAYAYRVTACNSSGCGNAGAVSSIRVVRPPAAAPGISAPGISSNGSFLVSWTGVSGATVYRLAESANGGVWSEIQAVANTTMLLSAKPDGSYVYRVSACNEGGCGPFSMNAAVLVVRPPSAPSLVAPAQSFDGAYTVNWSAVERASYYQLEEGINGGGFTIVLQNGSTAWATAGRGEATHAYRVAACNQGGCSAYSNSATVAVVLPPPVPTGLTARFVVVSPMPPWQARYFVAWNPVAGATSYEVSGRVGYSGPATSVQLNYVGSPQGASFIVRACRGSTCSAWSAPVTANGG